MTIDEFLTELRLARADAPRGTRVRLTPPGFSPRSTPFIRIVQPDRGPMCPIEFLADSMGIGVHAVAHETGARLGLDAEDAGNIIAAADGVQDMAHLRYRICSALGVSEN